MVIVEDGGDRIACIGRDLGRCHRRIRATNGRGRRAKRSREEDFCRRIALFARVNEGDWMRSGMR
jgi:hypothetical protein